MYKPKIRTTLQLAARNANALLPGKLELIVGCVDKCNQDCVIVNQVRLTIAKIYREMSIRITSLRLRSGTGFTRNSPLAIRHSSLIPEPLPQLLVRRLLPIHQNTHSIDLRSEPSEEKDAGDEHENRN